MSGRDQTREEMKTMNENEIKLWIIEELCTDKPAYWLVLLGLQILLKRLGRDLSEEAVIE